MTARAARSLRARAALALALATAAAGALAARPGGASSQDDCERAAAALDAWLQATVPRSGPLPDFPLPSALTAERDAAIPDDLQSVLYAYDAQTVRHARVAQALVDGREVRAYAYRVGGACHHGVLELLDAGTGARLAVPHAPAPGASSDPADDRTYDDERLLQVGARPYFAHLTWSQGFVTLYDLRSIRASESAARPAPMCVVQRVAASRERVRFAADAALCAAVLAHRVDDSLVRRGASVPLDEEGGRAAQAIAHYSGSAASPIADEVARFALVGQGTADLLNNGLRQHIGIVARELEIRRGCGGQTRTEWPVVLAADGSVADAPANRIALERASARARVFEFGGSTYFETRSREGDLGVPTHEIWRLDGGGGTRMCEFNPARYEVRGAAARR